MLVMSGSWGETVVELYGLVTRLDDWRGCLRSRMMWFFEGKSEWTGEEGDGLEADGAGAGLIDVILQCHRRNSCQQETSVQTTSEYALFKKADKKKRKSRKEVFLTSGTAAVAKATADGPKCGGAMTTFLALTLYHVIMSPGFNSSNSNSKLHHKRILDL